MLFKKLVRRFAIKLGILLDSVSAEIARATLPKFGNSQKNLVIAMPRRFLNPEYIFLGNNITIGAGSHLLAYTQYPIVKWKHLENQAIQQFSPKISVGNRVSATANLQIAAAHEITIEDDVMLASNINITDVYHGFENAIQPYKYQKLFRGAPICIKKGCWIGQNVVVLPGVTIGELTIVGANSVVTKSLPDRCIAVGAPAKVIKMWDDTTGKWISV